MTSVSYLEDKRRKRRRKIVRVNIILKTQKEREIEEPERLLQFQMRKEFKVFGILTRFCLIPV